jgi:hypothetical protein
LPEVYGDICPPQRRLLLVEKRRSPANRCRAAALVQVAGVHDVAEWRRPPRRGLLRRRSGARPIPHGHLTPAVATGVAIGAIVVGWLIYDVLWFVARGPRWCRRGLDRRASSRGVRPNDLLSGRAAFCTGALLATIMTGNVAMTIMPSQRVLVARWRPDVLLILRRTRRRLGRSTTTT